METLKIDKTNHTPGVDFEESGHLSIVGRSLCEDPRNFYEPLLKWCQKLDAKEISLVIKLDYLNTSSTKYMSQIIRTLDANSKIKNREIKWYYEEDDEEMLELGQIFEESTFATNFFYYQSA